jgi:hypothetical protein
MGRTSTGVCEDGDNSADGGFEDLLILIPASGALAGVLKRMASHGLLKRLPYLLETSPFPVNRGYVGASSSWSGANHSASLRCERCIREQLTFQSELAYLPGIAQPIPAERQKTREILFLLSDFCRYAAGRGEP